MSPGVVLGPTYRVVACACPLQTKPRVLKPHEWCEFCQCRRCGGPAARAAAAAARGQYGYNDASSSARGGDGDDNGDLWLSLERLGLEGLATVTADGCLLLALLGCAVSTAVYAQDRLHRYLYLLAAVAGSFLLRDLVVSRGRQRK